MKFDYSKLPPDWSCIVIDGDPGAGKTTLAKEIAKTLAAEITSFDDYLPENSDDKRQYAEKLNYVKLRRDISQAGPKIIVEGVLALKILDNVGVRHDYHVFIKRFDGFIGWRFAEYLESGVKPPKDKFWQEIVQYYKERKPFDVCDQELSRDICARPEG